MVKYFNKKLKSIKFNHALALEQNDFDGVHDLRVDIKRMKAFFNLVESLNPEFNSKNKFKYFRKITKSAGGLRDVQVQQKLAEDIKNALSLEIYEYESFLKDIEIDNLESLRNNSERELVNKLDESEKAIKGILKKISQIAAETKAQGRFYNLNNNMILLSNDNNLEEEVLHKVRILAKETHYTIEVIQQCFSLFADTGDFVKKIKKVHQNLGKWHDYEISRAYLSDFLKKTGKSSSSEPYHNVLQFIKKEKTSYRKNIQTVFDAFNKSAVLL